MNNLIYVGAIGVGATTLLIEAFRNFNSQSGEHPFELYPILKGVEVRNLCTTGETIAGFVFYATLYLVVYAVVLGSAEVYELVLSASKASTEIGATGDVSLPGSDPLLLSSTGYGKPIFVSALLISFLSVGAVKPIEATMRNLAHRLAGIPRGVYKVIESLRAVPFEELSRGYPTPLRKKFQANAAPLDPKNSYATQREEIERTLTAIDCLSVATNSDNQTLYFPLYHMSELTDLTRRLGLELSELEGDIGNIGKHADTGASNQAAPVDGAALFSDIARKAALARSNTMAIFAVLFVRNNRSIFSQSGASGRKARLVATDPVDKIRKFVEEDYNAEQNCFAISLAMALILGSIVTFALYTSWYGWTAESDKKVYATELAQVQRELASNAVGLKCGTLPQEVCADREAFHRYVVSQRSDIIKATIWDTVHSAALVFFSVFFVLLGREVRIEQQSWPTNWRFHQFPFLRLLTMSLLSGIVAVFVSAMVNLIHLAWDADFKLTQTQIIFLFQQSGAFFGLHFGAGLILSFAALIAMDKHDHLHSLWSVAIGLAGSVVYGAYMWLIIFLTYQGTFPVDPANALFSRHLRDTFIFLTVPFFFLVFFTILLEVTERENAVLKSLEKQKLLSETVTS